MNKTLRVSADECMSEFEYNYVGVVLRRVPYKCEENQHVLEDMLCNDPFGHKEVSVNNVIC